jgi:hypothetical protein
MSKTILDYSNTIIYKISCKNTTISDVYVGHTTNFVQRKQSHRYCCNNTVSSDHQPKLYQTIREHGGWDNWNMEIIAFRNCKDLYEARLFEQEYYDSLGATLNSVLPLPPPTPTSSRTCEGRSNKPAILVSDNHKKIKTDTQMSAKYSCETCNYYTCKTSSYKKHIKTVKHHMLTNGYANVSDCHICDCGKEFKHRQGLYRHKKTCSLFSKHSHTEEPIIIVSSNDDILHKLTNTNKMLSSTVMELLTENRDFKQLLMDQNKHMMEMYKTTNVPHENTVTD